MTTGPTAPEGTGTLVTVRFWAAARAAAGVAEEQVSAATLAELVQQLGERHGPALARVLSYCSFVVDGTPASGRRERAGVIAAGEPPPLPAVELAPGSVIEALPPFAGGAGALPAPAPRAGVTRDGAWPELMTTVGCLAAAGLLAGAAAWGRPALALALALVQLAVAVGWTGQLERDRSLLVLPALTGLVADAVLLADRSRAEGTVVAVIGLAFVAALVQQLARHPRRRVTAQLASVVSAVFLVALAALLLPLRQLEHGTTAALALLAGAAFAVVVARVLPLPAVPARLAGVAAAALAGALDGWGAASGTSSGTAAGRLTPWEAAGVAAAAGLAAAVVDLALWQARADAPRGDAIPDADLGAGDLGAGEAGAGEIGEDRVGDGGVRSAALPGRLMGVLLGALPVAAAVPVGYLVARAALG